MTRPATDRVRESMFNLIASRMSFDGIHVLDLFCGTGALGLESISRGAESAIFVETHRTVIGVARQNAERIGVSDQCSFYRRDAFKFVSSASGRFDLVFADPPYEIKRLTELPSIVVPSLRPDGLFLLEHDRRYNFKETDDWVESRAYGRTIVSIFRPTEKDQ